MKSTFIPSFSTSFIVFLHRKYPHQTSTFLSVILSLSLLPYISQSFAQDNTAFSQRPDPYGQTWNQQVTPNPAGQNKTTTADGRLTLRSYYSGDSSQTYQSPTVVLSFLEADIHLQNLTQSKLSLDLDSTFILDVTEAHERRFGETERLDQIRNLALTQPLGQLKLSFGRRLVTEAGNAWVDGIDIRYHFNQKQSSVGFYGGLSPDRFDRSLTLDYQALGTYLTIHRSGLDLNFAYNLLLYQAQLDRQFLHQRTHYKVTDGLFFSNYLILDFGDSPQITTFLSTIDYTPIKALNFSINLTQYTLEQYRNQFIYRDIIEPNQVLLLGNEVIDLTYQRLRFSTSWRVTEDLRPYLSTELKSRAQDGRKAYFYTLGASHQNLFGSKIETDLQIQWAQNFKAEHLIIALSMHRDLSSLFSIDARFTSFNGETLDEVTDRNLLFKEAQTIYLMGVTLLSRLSKSHHLLVTYDLVHESEVADYKSDDALSIHTLSFFYSYLY